MGTNVSPTGNEYVTGLVSLVCILRMTPRASEFTVSSLSRSMCRVFGLFFPRERTLLLGRVITLGFLQARSIDIPRALLIR